MTDDWDFYSVQARLLLSDLDKMLGSALAKNQEVRTLLDFLARRNFDLDEENKTLRQLVRDLYTSPQDQSLRQKAKDWIGNEHGN